MSTMDGVDVVVAGLPGVGKATLMKGLGATQRSQESNLHDLRLTTKYYTADLVVRCDKGLHKSAAPPTPALGGGDQQQRQVQALLLVVDASSENSLKQASIAKLFGTEAAQRVVDSAVQICGGWGVTKGSRAEYLYRTVRALRIYEGTSEIQRLTITRSERIVRKQGEVNRTAL